ncbi:MAG: radical SAM protein [Firmicutes bacterium]|nr:radical SAM protein [Bacillota bacterium]
MLDEINRKTKAVVQMTLTTYDDKLCAILEPNVCNTQRRIEVLDEMRKRGIPTVVWLCPILPYINDTEANIKAILEECARVGVKGIICFGMGLTLRDGDREYYYEALDKHFPGLKQRYMKEYGNSYMLPSPREKELMSLFTQFCEDHGILCRPDDCFSYMQEFPEKEEQLSFFES